jgi:hypothetical protein
MVKKENLFGKRFSVSSLLINS